MKMIESHKWSDNMVLSQNIKHNNLEHFSSIEEDVYLSNEL